MKRTNRKKSGRVRDPRGTRRRAADSETPLTDALRRLLTPRHAAAIVKKLVARAEAGDVRAAEVVLDRLGVPSRATAQVQLLTLREK